MNSLIPQLNSFFASPWFFWAGAIAAAGPTIIHLLNRRRFRTVEWAAMDFLRDALQRNRRAMQIRDLILLVLRTFAILLIGLALARPIYTSASFPFWAIAFPAFMAAILLFVVGVAMWGNKAVRWSSWAAVLLLLAIGVGALVWQSSRETLIAEDGGQDDPVHVVLVFDNSLSMAYETPLEGSLLNQAKETSKEFLNRLPDGSSVSVVAACGTSAPITSDSQSPPDAFDTIDRIECVDRNCSIQQCLAAAKTAIEQGPDLSHRVVILSDQQESTWRGLEATDLELAEHAQFVKIGPDERENTWISEFKLQDDVADPETPSTFVAKVRHQGESERKLNIRLMVDGVETASRFITVAAGGEREISFQHLFSDQAPEPGRPTMLPVSVVLEPDQLPLDDERCLAAPVMAATPVVFIDEVGELENAAVGKVGETLPLRRWLAPKSASSQVKNLGAVRHLRPDSVTRDSLADARLVVIAGVADPSGIADLLREYVAQGGSLVVAAGGNFDPARWNALQEDPQTALLPTPVRENLIGSLPARGDSNYRWFYLNFESLQNHPWFQFADETDEYLRDFYSDPIIFQAVDASTSQEWRENFAANERQRLVDRLRTYALSDGEAGSTANEADWLLWKATAKADDWVTLAEQARSTVQAASINDRETVFETWLSGRDRDVSRIVQDRAPHEIGGYELPDLPPFLVQRSIGLGNVLFITTGLAPQWNTIARDSHIVVFGRLLRAQLVNSIPQRNRLPSERIASQLSINTNEQSVWLQRPDASETFSPLDVGYLAGDQRGVVIEGAYQRGVYKIVKSPVDEAPDDNATVVDLLAINGFADESELQTLSPTEFDKRFGAEPVYWVARNQPISLSGPRQVGRNLWWILALAVLLLLIFELLVASGMLFAATRTGGGPAVDAFGNPTNRGVAV